MKKEDAGERQAGSLQLHPADLSNRCNNNRHEGKFCDGKGRNNETAVLDANCKEERCTGKMTVWH